MTEEFERFLKTKSEKSRSQYKTLLNPFFNYLDDKEKSIDSFDEVEVLDYIRENGYKKYVQSVNEYGKEALSNNTLEQIYNAIQHFVHWQRERANTAEEHFKNNKRLSRIKSITPVNRIQKLSVSKWLSLDELSQVLSKSKKEDDRIFHLFYLLGWFGCRISELIESENRREIDWEKGRIVFLTEKGKFERPNYFDEKTRDILNTALSENHLRTPAPYWKLNKYQELINMDFTFHNFRNTADHYFRESLGDDTLVSLILGWKVGDDMPSYYDGRREAQIKRAMTKKHYFNDLNLK